MVAAREWYSKFLKLLLVLNEQQLVRLRNDIDIELRNRSHEKR